MVLILKRLINCDVQIRFKAENFAKPIAEKWNSKEKVMVKEREVKATLMEVSLIAEKWNSEEKVMVKEREAKATVVAYGGHIFLLFCITRVRRRSSSWPTR